MTPATVICRPFSLLWSFYPLLAHADSSSSWYRQQLRPLHCSYHIPFFKDQHVKGGQKHITTLNLHVLSYFETGGKIKKKNQTNRNPRKQNNPLANECLVTPLLSVSKERTSATCQWLYEGCRANMGNENQISFSKPGCPFFF